MASTEEILMSRRRQAEAATSGTLSPIVRLWILRLLFPLGLHRHFILKHDFNSDALAEALDLHEWIQPGPQEFNVLAVRRQVRSAYEAMEENASAVTVPDQLAHNIARLQTLVGLSHADCRILEFAVMIHSERLLDDLADCLGNLSTAKVCHTLSILLGIPERDVRAALGTQGILARSGLVAIGRHGVTVLRNKLNLISEQFADTIASTDADPASLLRDTVSLCAPPQLTISDYAHVRASLDVLRPYLKKAVATARVGVNIFLHGDPGTGKSQLAKVLAQELGCELFEVASEDTDGDAVNGAKRLRAFRAAQSFFAQRRALILFDEVEDVFNDGDSIFGRKSTAQTRKAWLNRTLEENLVPTLWLSNSIRGIDPAFIRRFDMVIEIPVPPKSHRQHILSAVCANLVPLRVVQRIAEVETLAPAVVTRAADVVRTIHGEIGERASAAAFELLIDNTLEAQGHGRIRRHDPHELPQVYDPAFIHADADLSAVTQGLLHAKSGRLCLFGPPGTGKTAYARWLAKQMEIPLTVKRASDLMSMWVGGSEKNIATAFRDAEHEGALLLIDEVDSFLQDRRQAQKAWEVTLVNEMLTQMESIPGVFIASTNLMEGLDQAALRRFDLKVKFDYLKPDQAAELLRRYCVELSWPTPPSDVSTRISRLTALTPGDFAAVMRQHRFRPMGSAAALVNALEAECALKQGTKRAIGFH
jgi:SpoVK/Ycf46/Vps4 family AAA+-type ATPase